MRIGLIQMLVETDKQKNLNKAAKKINELSNIGIDMAILPEMFNCPYSSDYFKQFAEAEGENTFLHLQSLARENSIYLVGGSIPEIENGNIYNTSFVFDRTGKPIAKHRKVHLFDVAIEGGQHFKESDTFSPGDKSTIFDTEFGKMGLCICFDMRFPELAMKMTLEGAKVIIAPAAFNMTTGPAHWELLFRQRAIDNQLYTVGVAPAKDESSSYLSYGNSIVVSPWGDVLYRARYEETEQIVDIDLSYNDKIRQQLPLLSARKEGVYQINK